MHATLMVRLLRVCAASGLRGLCIPSLNHLSRPITAILALHCNVFVTLEEGLEAISSCQYGWPGKLSRDSRSLTYVCVPHVKKNAIVVALWLNFFGIV